MPTLIIQLPGLPPVEHILRDEMMTIGRMKGNTIALDDPSVSVSHAKITRKGVDFFLKDLNSTNGTMLNGQSINEARLRDGDQLKFGEVVAYYRAEPDFVSSVPGQNPALLPPSAPTATVAPQAVIPAAASSSTFVSKRLVTQASALPVVSAAPPSAPKSSPAKLARRNKSKWRVPLALGVVALLVGAGILAKSYLANESVPKPSSLVAAVPPAGTLPGKLVTGNPSSVGGGTRPVSGLAPKTSTAAPAETKSVADLKRALTAADVNERRHAAEALHGLGSGAKEAVPELRAALSDSDAEVRMWSALALINNKSYDKATIPILIRVLHHENPMLRQVSCLSLALIPSEETDKETVIAALADTANKDDDSDVRKAAVSALKIISPDSAAAGK